MSWKPRKGEKLFKFDFYRGRCLYWGLFECLNRRFPIRFTSENVLPQMIRLKETIALIKAVFFLQFLVLNLFFSDQVWRSHKLLLHHRCNWDQKNVYSNDCWNKYIMDAIPFENVRTLSNNSMQRLRTDLFKKNLVEEKNGAVVFHLRVIVADWLDDQKSVDQCCFHNKTNCCRYLDPQWHTNSMVLKNNAGQISFSNQLSPHSRLVNCMQWFGKHIITQFNRACLCRPMA